MKNFPPYFWFFVSIFGDHLICISHICQYVFLIYSVVGQVCPRTEEQISVPIAVNNFQ